MQTKQVQRMIRVNHAGEVGADAIYRGQMAVLHSSPSAPIIQHMWDQEKEHLKAFDNLIPSTRTRPSLLRPLWEGLGYSLGYISASISVEAAMATTEAVETVISDHYNEYL